MSQLLLEIGTEELPPALLAPGAAGLESRVRQLLADREIACGPARQFFTPRRLAVRFSDVAPERPARTVEVQGPPRKATFGPDGKPTKTALGFARAQGRSPEDLYVKQTAKGEYVCVRKEEPALPTADVLASGLPAVLAALPFPRSMRWLEDKTRFPRPVRWLVCLLDDKVVEFEFAGLRSSNVTRGHRFAARAVALPGPAQYEQLLEEQQVICSFERRRDFVRQACADACAPLPARPVPDAELLDETACITEFPVPILCRFAPEHLRLPAAVLKTALKKHQRCFAVEDGRGELVPCFVAVANTPGCDARRVGRWYEDAVESRLRDARFFFEADSKLGLEPLVEEEKKVTWIEGMGSYFDKTERLVALCGHLAESVPDADPGHLRAAARLCKADLLTQVVREKEFTSLQGVMGGIYARLAGQPGAVADAIAEQYLPRAAGDDLPRTLAGALLAVADKTDNIVATFLSGAIPTGSEDPFALRRQAYGLLAIVLEHRLDLDLDRLLKQALALFPSADPERAAQLAPFLAERLEALLADKGIPYDISDAVMETTWHHPARALAAARALLALRPRPDFEKLVIGQKRVANILKGLDVAGAPDPALFAEPAERGLLDSARQSEPGIAAAMKKFDFGPALEQLLTLRPAIDRFFDDVLVMAEDEQLKTNRLRLLLLVRSLFRQVADLSRVVIEGQ